MAKKVRAATKIVVSKRKPIPVGVRYDVLSRYKFRCCACGVSARSARLEIDHKIPVAKGGTDIAANLQVLCIACNRGKGAKLKRKRKPS